VIRGGAIGDFILTLPVLTALKQQFPQVHLEVLGYSHIAGLAAAGHLVDGVQSIEARALAGFFAPQGPLDPTLAAYFSTFGLIVSYLYDPENVFRDNIARCSKAQFLPGPHRPPEDGIQHATHLFLRPLERLAIFDADPVPQLALPPGESLPAGDWLAIHPGSGSETKNWPESKWAQLLRLLTTQTSLRILLVGGEVEVDRLARLKSVCPADRVKSAQCLPLVELGPLLAQCRGFVGHDSGITHLAAALGSTGLALWGPSNPEVWRPLSPRFKVLARPEPLEALEVDTVYEAIQSVISPAA
jgi:heptosyltransferase-2